MMTMKITIIVIVIINNNESITKTVKTKGNTYSSVTSTDDERQPANRNSAGYTG